MKFDFDQISEEGLNVKLDDISWLPSECDFDKPVFAAAFCRKRKSGIFVQGEFKAVVVLVCDRCLEEFRLPLDVEFIVNVEMRSAVGIQENEHQCGKAEMDSFYVDKAELDLSYLFMQQVLVSLPMKRLCSADCRGLCNQCGVNLNLYPEKCQCEEENESPFKVLARIKKVK